MSDVRSKKEDVYVRTDTVYIEREAEKTVAVVGPNVEIDKDGNVTSMEYSKRSAVNDPDVADRLCEGGPCHPFGQGYTNVLRTALTERPPESLFGIAAQQRPKKQRKFTREVETQT